ncbi:type II secretion system secretin GspD [Pseudoduganella sp. DS3]|uniref:Type IV pilus biogenesis and competence protein PilQ n=1 Tax=Pseudoduganella guangdongensis TaxID=2692179 RepID=A0A6N9HMR9_9BURK|nr:type II secretion system secretin GspD [Pseudoduganella guangdongensis]MYN04152.1 type II secretion system secretin GspD [Pseudoduganella guangdongensis]
MKKHTASPKSFPALRRLSAAAMLCCALAPAAAPVTAWAQPNDEAALNFVGADIESVIKAVGHYTNITFLIDPRVKGTISLVSEKSITKSQAFSLLASALRLQGYAIVSGDGYAKVVPEAEAKLQASPTVVGGTKSPQGDQVVTQIFHLNHENSANLVTVLRPLITPNNTINANPGNNTLVITDYADNLKRLAKIIASLDAPSAADLDVIPVRYAIASDLAAMINKLLEPGAGGDSGRVNLVPDPRTNSLVVRAPSAARANLAKSLIAKLDQPTAQAGNVHVVYLKNAEATKLAETLRAVVSGDTSAAGGQAGGLASLGGGNSGTGQINQSGMGQTSQGGNQSGGPSNPALSGSGNRSGGTTSGGGGQAGFIQADATTNTLIITAPEAVYRNLRTVIDQLDVRRAQVYIESMIVEINANKLSEFGVQWAGLSGNDGSTYRVGGGTTYTRAGNSSMVNLAALIDGKSGAQPPSGGLTLGIFKQLANGKLGLGAVAHALGTDGDSNILSTPNMLTLDNEVATIKVGQNVPIVTGSFTTTSGTNNNPFQTVDRKDIGITLKVRPQISEGGTIKLAIYNESSSIDDVTNTAGLILKNRVIETNIIADDGQVLVLGGLIQDDANDGVDKVPGLGDLPLIGHLFKYQKRERKKTNLMVFLRPVVVRNREQGMNLTADRYDYMRATQQAAMPEPSITVQSLGAAMLPELQDGKPVGSGQLAKPIAPAAPSVPEQKQQQ